MLFDVSTKRYITSVSPRRNSDEGACDRILSGVPDASVALGSFQKTVVPFVPSSVVTCISSVQLVTVGRVESNVLHNDSNN